ncbi:hypothetical protein SASPL_137238 [Salvia splendens]|uniref:Mitochondrial import inner membrane translocase subunit TIM17 n=1 Tax=Salvia splendens TaxID=180675 RepID=A0A8X8ZCS3_SALSN|nr:hypothetical protein SASPL_137238 [Salvia splendens]
MGTPETSREPCPDRIFDDVGGAFGMGAVGGGAFHFLKGLYNSPKGERLIGGTQAVRMNAPRVGGSFAVWGGLFSTFDCTMVYMRQKEDPWNSIIAGAATGGFLQMRQGMGAASRSALFGGVLLALIEGAGIMLNKVMSAQQNFPPMEDPVPNVAGMPGHPMGQLPGQPSVNVESMDAGSSSSSPSSSSWFGGLFGGKEETTSNDGSKTKDCLLMATVFNIEIHLSLEIDDNKSSFAVFCQSSAPGRLPGLTREQKFDAGEIILEKVERLDFFLGMPDDDRIAFVLRVLAKYGSG